MTKIRLCIVIPMYNEERIAKESLQTILPYTRQLPPIVTVLVVNDCSTDKTEAIVEEIIEQQDDDHLVMLTHKDNKRYGGANRTGAAYAIAHNYDYVLYMDSDLTNHPGYLKDFYEKIEQNYDYIKATRYSKGGGFDGVDWRRIFVSRWGNSVEVR